MIRMDLTAGERLAEISLAEDRFHLILNPRLQLVDEGGADLQCGNLPTGDALSIILPQEYGSRGLQELVLARRMDDDDHANPLTYINANHASYCNRGTL